MLTNKAHAFLGGTTLLIISYFIFPGRATVVHVMDVAALVLSSDLIVSGRITSVNQQGATIINMPTGPASGKKLLAALAIDETLKGSIEKPNLFLEFVTPDAPSGVRGIPDGQYGIFFLQRGTSGDYRVSDPVYPFLPAIPNGRSSSGPPLDRVIAKLGEVLIHDRSDELGRSSALDALATIQGRSAIETLRRALGTSSGDFQLRIAAKLVARNDVSGLEVVEGALLHPAGRPDYLLLNLAGSLGGLRDPKSVPALKRLLETNNPQITKGVAIALRQSRSGDALEPLSRLLNNSDEQVRYYAVVGLGEITKQDEWTPAFPEFREHEAKYVSYWRDWAASNFPRVDHP